jgi:hypothetical protein
MPKRIAWIAKARGADSVTTMVATVPPINSITNNSSCEVKVTGKRSVPSDPGNTDSITSPAGKTIRPNTSIPKKKASKLRNNDNKLELKLNYLNLIRFI